MFSISNPYLVYSTLELISGVDMDQQRCEQRFLGDHIHCLCSDTGNPLCSTVLGNQKASYSIPYVKAGQTGLDRAWKMILENQHDVCMEKWNMEYV